MALTGKPEVTPERAAFYKDISAQHLSPLWEVFSTLITKEPAAACNAHQWCYDDIRPALMRAGELITAKEAERRVLVLENPAMPGQARITTSLYAGLQLVLPGEIAPAHRHTQSALRFVLEGEGAHTCVDGEKTLMSFGDFIITPPWAWHDHGNNSQEPMVWLDGLDIPMASFFNVSFAEGYGSDEYPLSRQAGDSAARYGANMLPVDYKPGTQVSPLFNYPYQRSREALESMKQQDEWDPCHGLKLQYINPANGESAMPTMSVFLQLLPNGFVTEPYRCTDATVIVPVEGKGRSIVDGQVIEWGPRDIVVLPSWSRVVHESHTESVLFSFSDRVAQQKLGFWREQRGNA